MLSLVRRNLKVLYDKIRKFLYVSNFVSLMRPYMVLVSDLGYFPYDTNLSSTKLAKLSFIGSAIKIIFITFLCPFIIGKMKFVPRTWKESFFTVHVISVYTFGIACLWAIFVSSRSKMHLLRMVSTVSRVLSPEEFCTMAKWMYAMDIVRICFFMRSVFDFPDELWLFITTVATHYIYIAILSFTILFTNCLYVLSLCFRKINTSLEKLKTSLATDEPHLLRRIYHSQKNPTLLLELKMLRRQHLEYSRLIDAMNESFGLEIIVIVALHVMDDTSNLYLYLAQNTEDGKIVNLWTFQMMYVVSTSLIVIAMAMASEKIKGQVKNIGTNIHRILVIIFDQQISSELELFSMQVIQQNRTIIAKGLVIDATLLTKIVGVVTTYLLILTQFLLRKTC